MLYWHKASARSAPAPLTSWTKSPWLCVPQRSCNKCLLSCALPIQPLVMSRGRRWGRRGESIWVQLLFLRRLNSCCILAFSFSLNNHLLFSPLLLVGRHISYIIYSTIPETAISLESGMALLWAAGSYSVNTSDNIRYPNCSARIYPFSSHSCVTGASCGYKKRHYSPFQVLSSPSCHSKL